METIRIRGARTHNLKNIDLDIPRNRFVVLTGLSGSGKSSLAFDTLYAEGQRRYAESVSSYARQFMDMMDKPDVDSIEGLSPSISIEQHTATPSSRSTVSTVTEIADYLRLLFSRAGVPFCPVHDQPLRRSGIHDMVDAALSLPPETKVMIVAPIVKQGVVDAEMVTKEMMRRGYVRLLVDGEVRLCEEMGTLEPNVAHDIDVVVDRLKISDLVRTRLAESFETATKLTDGKASLVNMTTGERLDFSLKYGCPVCGYAMGELTPAMFSFNNALGACPKCEGNGTLEQFDPNIVVKDAQQSLAEGAVCGYSPRNRMNFARISQLASAMNFSLTEPWHRLPSWAKTVVLYGSDALKETGAKAPVHFDGVIPLLEKQWQGARSEGTKAGLRMMRRVGSCPACSGARYRKEVHSVYLGTGVEKLNIVDISELTLDDLLARLDRLHLTEEQRQIALGPLGEIKKRVGFLIDVGLGYLTLSREAKTLSGGEMQRIRLAGQIGSGLTGVTYVLDEPTIGLHQRDNEKLIKMMRRLTDAGNTLVVVEHDIDVIRAADYVVDMGPGAGELGGRIVAAGTPEEIMRIPESKTGAYLSGRSVIHVANEPMENPTACALRLVGARGHNLKNLTCHFPVGAISVVTGVSGSGKSTLINDTLAVAMRRHFYKSKDQPLPYDRIEGLEYFDKIIDVDQSPIGKTPRSNPATYTGLFTQIREVFASTQAAKERGYDTGRFSFNTPGGRCEACEGDGQIKIEMGFLPPVYVTCSTCMGHRYNRETLEVKYRGKSIADVLEMTVHEALEFFAVWPGIVRKLQMLSDVGLGYIRLGQSATTFSGGEAQRIKLAEELSRRDTGRTLYVLDEPTTGLHFDDVAALMAVLRRLTALGNTVIVIEHNLDVIRLADWIVDIGPDGGQKGGDLVVEGAPEKIMQTPNSLTGRYLRQAIETRSLRR